MALIKCSECGKEISTTAERCPHCGYCTNHGRSVVETKALLVKWGVFVILIIIGFVMIFTNAEMFFKVSDSLQYYRSWSDAGKAGFWKFVIGALLLVCGIINMVGIKKQSESIKGNGFTSNVSEHRANDTDAPDRWTCACGRKNPKYVSTCTCGVNRRDMK